jgi:endoglucanase
MSWREELLLLIKELTQLPGPSGYEHRVRDKIVELVKPYADRLWIDAWGNVIAVKKGKTSDRRLMLAAHMDEIGLFVSHIEDDGFLRAIPIGGVLERTLLYQRVIVVTRTGRMIRGVIGLKPPHVIKPEEAQKVPELRELFIDVGASSKEEVEKLGVRNGDIVVFDRDVSELSGNRITGKAFDDRVGVAVLIKALEMMGQPEVDAYFVFTVQEEVGLKGARTSAYGITPDVALAVDVTIASDVPGVAKSEWFTRLGRGPAIKIVDGRNATGLIAHPKVVDFLVTLAEKHKIPYQLDVVPGGTTDASIIALNKDGVPAGTISIPSRYIHSPVEVLDLEDVNNASKLAAAFASEATEEWIKSLKGMVIK